MDLSANGEVIEPLDVRSDGLKRPVENGDLDVRSLKKAKNGGDMQKVAEIVLVLATMGTIRGGRVPTEVEVEMMAEARAKLVELCQGFAPKDVFPRDAFGAVIEDLGLSKTSDQRLGFGPRKMSIAEKLRLSKQKMEKSEEFALHSATYSSQRLQTNVGSTAESRGTSPAVRITSSEKPSQVPTSFGGSRPSPLGHISAANPTPLPYQLPTSEVRPVVSSGLPSSDLGKDFSSRADKPHFRMNGKSNGGYYASQVQANSSGDHTKTPPWSVQQQTSSAAKIVSDNKVPVPAAVKVDRAAEISRVAPQAIISKPFITQTTSVNPPSIHQHIQQGVKFVQAPLRNSHNEICKIVQKLLQPQLSEHPIWTPPSRDYMNKALACQMCKLIINEVDNVLICDACEKGYHINCLQLYNQKTVPRGDWHCGKCLSLSNGKPIHPKYGRVMRNSTAPKVSSNATAVQLSLEKKVETLDGKDNLQRITANGNSGIQSASTSAMDNKFNHFVASVVKSEGNGALSSEGIKVGEPSSGPGPNNLMKTSGAACVTPADTLDHSQAYGHPNANDQKGMPNSSEHSSKQCPETNFKELKKSCGEEFQERNRSDEAKQDEQGVPLANHVGTTGTIIGPREHGGPLSVGSHNVDWIGDIVQVVDERTYYQSCSINGVVYKVQDHALFRSDSNILTPSKLQGMWEDSKTRSKWIFVSRCYFPADLPEAVGRPCAPEINEVYESNHNTAVRAGLIEGPCEVLPPRRFIEENERRAHLGMEGIGMEGSGGLHPLFICKWFYDEPKGLFRAVTS